MAHWTVAFISCSTTLFIPIAAKNIEKHIQIIIRNFRTFAPSTFSKLMLTAHFIISLMSVLEIDFQNYQMFVFSLKSILIFPHVFLLTQLCSFNLALKLSLNVLIWTWLWCSFWVQLIRVFLQSNIKLSLNLIFVHCLNNHVCRIQIDNLPQIRN